MTIKEMIGRWEFVCKNYLVESTVELCKLREINVWRIIHVEGQKSPSLQTHIGARAPPKVLITVNHSTPTFTALTVYTGFESKCNYRYQKKTVFWTTAILQQQNRRNKQIWFFVKYVQSPVLNFRGQNLDLSKKIDPVPHSRRNKNLTFEITRMENGKKKLSNSVGKRLFHATKKRPIATWNDLSTSTVSSRATCCKMCHLSICPRPINITTNKAIPLPVHGYVWQSPPR